MKPSSSSLFDHAMGFVSAVRRAGIDADPSRAMSFFDGLRHIDIGNATEVRAAAGATLVHRERDRHRFDEVFRDYWFGTKRPDLEIPDAGAETLGGADDVPGTLAPAPMGDESGDRHERTGYSADESLRTKDLALIDNDELANARRFVRDLASLFASVKSHRLVTSPHGRHFDFRRMLRAQSTTGGDDLSIVRRRRDKRKLRLVLLCDVSGSMESYAGLLVEFIVGLRRELSQTDIAVFATRLTVISDLVTRQAVGATMREVAARARDWGGGTDIGGCLREFNERFAAEMVRDDTVVVLLSDGWDRGEADLMREQIALLGRRAYKLLWLNPLLGHSDYEPLTRGMQAALPHIDYFLPAHNLDSLGELAHTLRDIYRDPTYH